MASSKPPQERMVDPFASYNSNEVNRLTEMVGLGENGIITYPSLQVSINDSTSVIVSEGYVLKDDVLIKITSPHIVSFYDADHYTDPTLPFLQEGYNYIVLDYSYIKSRPAPEANIKILKWSDRHLYTSANNLYLLKVVEIIKLSPTNYQISRVLDYDPDTPTNQREGIKTFTGAKYDIPTHTSEDQGRTLYSSEEDDFAFGLSNRWVKMQEATSVSKNTSARTKGELVYLTGLVLPAISSSAISTADGVVTVVGNPGRVQTTGYVEDVPIESGITLNVGDLLFLSLVEAGKVTSVETYLYSQFVGRCLEITGSGTTCSMLFVRGFVSPTNAAAASVGFSQTLTVGNWILDAGLYYQDIDTSIIDGSNALVSARDTATDIIIEPTLVDFSDLISSVRIWMPNNTTQLDVTLIGRKFSTTTGNTIECVRDTLHAGVSWNPVGPLYYQDVDITTIGTKSVAVEVRDLADNMKIRPTIELININTLRIWMPDNTHNLHITAMGPKVTASIFTTVNSTLVNTGWILSGGSYYQNIGIGNINKQNVIVNVKDNLNNEKIEPQDIEFVSVASVKIWMPNNTKTLEVLVVG